MIRLLSDMEADAYTLMATDEAILTAITQKKAPATLRFYQWKPQAVSIGYFQSAKKEVNKNYLFENGIYLVRRITGGGAVFHDKELTYTFFIHKDHVSDNIVESYKIICGAIIKGLKTIGINAKFSPINDLLINNKKFSGNAQTRRDNIIMQHGTILLEVDKNKMFSALNVPIEKISDKKIKELKNRVTSLKEEEKVCSFDKVRAALLKGFEKFGKISKANLSKFEIQLKDQLLKKYMSKEWTYAR
ncbi:MAG: Lipoate-protein ligase A subunit 1 [Candidatus Woesearchaeota archaeon]|nr:Lipoate-protein ligase A subunit 1 [Candidatus Woesearchaeota archaeon]